MKSCVGKTLEFCRENYTLDVQYALTPYQMNNFIIGYDFLELFLWVFE